MQQVMKAVEGGGGGVSPGQLKKALSASSFARTLKRGQAAVRRATQGVVRAAIDYDVEHAIALKARGYLESDAQRRFRYAQLAALVLSLIFIASIVVLLAMLCVKVNDVFDAVDGSDTSAKVTTLMDMAVEGANNARLATQNVLDVTSFARQTARVAGPQLESVANSTKDLVTDLRSWSFHPSLQIAPGG